MIDMLLLTALVFLVIAASTTLVGLYAAPDQGLPSLLYWLAAAALVTGAGLLLTHLGLREQA